jgi:exodeoxyribonuclease-5
LNSKNLQETLESKFPFSFTREQEVIVSAISDFTTSISTKNIFLLKGYAGTGKTTLISALVKSLSSVNKRSVLLAPTGRAAKVLSKYSNKQASTIHRKIYWIRSRKNGNTYIKIKENTHSNTIFIVDEASMIPEASDKSFGNRSLLDDLIEYVYDGIGCKLILIGDTAQLPPVHLDISPALDEGFFGNFL